MFAHYAPQAPANFLSTSVLDNNGFELYQRNGKIHIIKESKEIACAQRISGTFFVKAEKYLPPKPEKKHFAQPTQIQQAKELLRKSLFQTPKQGNYATPNTNQLFNYNDVYQLHRKMGHASVKKLRHLAKTTTGLTFTLPTKNQLSCLRFD